MTCQANNIPACYNVQCNANAFCTAEGASYRCQCNPGYTGDGKISCTSTASM